MVLSRFSCVDRPFADISFAPCLLAQMSIKVEWKPRNICTVEYDKAMKTGGPGFYALAVISHWMWPPPVLNMSFYDDVWTSGTLLTLQGLCPSCPPGAGRFLEIANDPPGSSPCNQPGSHSPNHLLYLPLTHWAAVHLP